MSGSITPRGWRFRLRVARFARRYALWGFMGTQGRRDMTTARWFSSRGNPLYRMLIGVSLLSMLALSACAGSGTSSDPGGASSNGGSSTAAATATAPGPTPTIGLQQITVAYCQHLLSLATANQIIPSSTPAIKITQGNPNDALSGACNYVVSASQVLLVIYFIPYNGPDPIPQSDIQSLLSQAAGNKITVSNLTAVSGIGDQAAYLDATMSDNGFTGTIHIFYVLEGKFIFDCFTVSFLSPMMASQDQLQQCATTVDANLRTS